MSSTSIGYFVWMGFNDKGSLTINHGEYVWMAELANLP
jgi:hypothetical protein